jgi:hypothetical protein
MEKNVKHFILLSALGMALQAGWGQGPPGRRMTPDQRARLKAEYIKEHPPRSSVGLIPLTDLGTGTYKGYEGGLYPGGKNVPPSAHLRAGLKIAQTIVPLDANGGKAQDGKIVFLSIGFSNTSLEFTAFKETADADAERNPRVVVVNGAIGNQPAQAQANPESTYWKMEGQRLEQAGVSPKQVEVIWIDEVIPGEPGEFPGDAKKLQGYLLDSLHNCMHFFPNVKMAYLSSRDYGGYTEVGGSPEPYAYQTAFAVKWLVADQIAGKPELNYDSSKGAVVAPWIAWGPYFWTDGAKGRKDGLTFLRSDYRADDGLHPSPAGLEKIVRVMMHFFQTDPTAQPWFIGQK